MNEITWESLATAAGASVLAGVIVQFLKIFLPTLSNRGTRQLAAFLGVVLVEAAVWFLNDDAGIAEYGLGLLVGIQAGLTASKSEEILSNGLDHVTAKA